MKLYSGSDDDLIKQIHDWHQSARDASKDWRVEAKTHYDFYAGRQWTPEETAVMEEELRNAVTFNRVGSLVDAVAGHQINNRSEVRFIPREIGDVQVSEILTGAGRWVEDEADTEDEEEEIFQDLLITGMGWSECRISYDEDVDGKVIPGERFSPLESYWDPNSTRRNLADSKFRMRGKWMDRDDALSKWPKLDKVDWQADKFLWDQDESQDEPHNAARAHFYEKDSRQWYNKHENEVFVLHVQWWEFEPVYRVGDPASGKILELSENKFTKLREYVDANDIKYVRQMRKKFFYAFIAGPHVLEKGPNTWDRGFTLQCVTGKRDNSGSWFGIVRALIDPQKWSNKFLSDLQDMIVSNRQGGAFVEETALVDPRNAEENWNQPNPLIMVRDGTLARGGIQERTPPQLPPALDRMIEWCIAAIPSVSGINQEFMGYADRDQPNVLEMQRKRSAINVLASLFSSLRKYRKDRARAMLHMIRTYLNDGRLIRVVGGDGKEQYIPLALDPRSEDYDIVIDEASTSPNQKEETFSVMLALMPYLVQAGIAPPVDVLDYMPLPASFIAKWKEILTPKGPDPMQQTMQAAAMAEVQKDQSDAELKRIQARKLQAEAEAQELENMAVKLGLVSIEDL